MYGEYEPGIGYITLTAENGINVTDRIVLEPEVYLALLAWVTRLADIVEGRRS